MGRIELRGTWSFCTDREKTGIEKKFYTKMYEDTINLPATVSEAKKGEASDTMNTGFLTDPYQFEGYTWYTRYVDLSDTKGEELFLVLERTRISHVWLDDYYIGSNHSLCTVHRYQLTPGTNPAEHKLTIMVDNTSYPTKGGHLTSPDTQTNWNGILGDIYIEIISRIHLTGVKLYPDAAGRKVAVKAVLQGTDKCRISAAVMEQEQTCPAIEGLFVRGENQFTCSLGERAELWSEHSPKMYTLRITLYPDTKEPEQQPLSEDFTFGLRDFKAAGRYFEINGRRAFLRGKHDGLIFPLTGYAPMDLNSWLTVLRTAKEYGINHYRFHTCCPPEAAFTAADLLGIYMEPELPFWGTVTEEGDANHDENEQQYLIGEGFRILDQYGNHPSFVMMSLGNELWGSKTRLNEILGRYKAYDSRHLYTQGSNNFQFMPCILENEDFFCGVRFSRDRLFRGSYAMCDAPQGHIQTKEPDTVYNYDRNIRPTEIADGSAANGEVTIQYGTGTKTVKMDSVAELIPEIPVISHEIGQYAMYPDYSEISKYTGVLKARNLETFRERLEQRGLLAKADQFFRASGRFAAECYKAELETALRSKELAGFQILDLQDFSGQGTALVGILNAFMENKGIISAAEWRQFCSDSVILAELPGLVFAAGEELCIKLKFACFSEKVFMSLKLEVSLSDNEDMYFSEVKTLQGDYSCEVLDLYDITVKLPETDIPKKLTIMLRIDGIDVSNRYDIWLYPKIRPAQPIKDIVITESLSEACSQLEQGRKVLYYPADLEAGNSVQGTYCTDFWCYPMFRAISESMGKPIPIGTLGLLIDSNHKAFEYFPSEFYTTPQWYDIIANSRAMILDGTDMEPIVWTIDNFERNHRLGNIFEAMTGEGRLLVCTCNLCGLPDSLPAKWLEYSLLQYMNSAEFNPKNTIGKGELSKLFMKGIPSQ